MKVLVAAFNQEKALVGAFSVITNLRMDLFEALPVDDVLQLGHHQPPRLLEHPLVPPAPLLPPDLRRHSVVLPHEDGVEAGQAGVLRGAPVPSLELEPEGGGVRVRAARAHYNNIINDKFYFHITYH